MSNKKNSLVLLLIGVSLAAVGCVSTGGTAIETHKKGMEGITGEDEYVVATKPIDRHFIGCAWSKQFGPVEDPSVGDIRTKKERSFSGMQSDFAFNRGIALGARPVAAPVQGEIGLQGGSIEKAKLEGVEIITPVSLADIPFEPDLNYITEALRLANFKIKDEKSNKASIGASATSQFGTATAVAEVGSQGRRGTEGEGLVVAYKLHTIDKGNYDKKESGNQKLELDKSIDMAGGSLIVKARLQAIEPGAGKSLPRNILWACPRADAMSRDMVAAWVVDLKSTDPKRKSLSIAFPAFPKIDDCSNFSGVVYTRIDPKTDKILRQKFNVSVVDADVTDSLKPKVWDTRVSIVDESFKIKLVKPYDL
jgi:hypothetical protein